MLIAESTEVNPSLLKSTGVKGTGCTHSVFAFASFALAFSFSVVGGTEPARKTADSDFNVAVHLGLHLDDD